jgi:hypothetical protein
MVPELKPAARKRRRLFVFLGIPQRQSVATPDNSLENSPCP